jgi:ABC-type molybdenum transport system ATPase subunit/photorepair protein PhrA
VRALTGRFDCDGLLAVGGEAQQAGTHAAQPAGGRERPRVALVSTELHLELCETAEVAAAPAFDLVRSGGERGPDEAPPPLGGAAAAARESAADELAAAALAAVGLRAEAAALPFGALSQGEQKLAMLARALARRPRLLILDEWGQGLDWAARARVLALLRRLGADAPLAARLQLLVVTHHLDELPVTVTHALQLERGGTAAFVGTLADWRAWSGGGARTPSTPG